MHVLDLTLFYALYNLASHGAFIDSLIIFLGKYLLYIIGVFIAYVLFDANRKSDTKKVYGYVVAVLGALVARFFIGSSIRFFYHRPRPFLALHIPHLLTETSYSFPSGHTIFLFALATGIWFVNKKQSYVLFVLALLVGLARVAAGVHYPSDIAGGIILGVLTAVLVVRLIAYVCGRLKQCKLC